MVIGENGKKERQPSLCNRLCDNWHHFLEILMVANFRYFREGKNATIVHGFLKEYLVMHRQRQLMEAIQKKVFPQHKSFVTKLGCFLWLLFSSTKDIGTKLKKHVKTSDNSLQLQNWKAGQEKDERLKRREAGLVAVVEILTAQKMAQSWSQIAQKVQTR